MAATNPAVAQNTSGSVSVPNVTRALSDCHRVSSELGKLPNPWRLLYDRLRVMCLSMVIASRTATSPSRSLSGFLEPIWIWKSRLRSSTSFASHAWHFSLSRRGFSQGVAPREPSVRPNSAGRINGAYGQADWTPIRYINRAYGHSTLAGLYMGS
jgi:hypothetical protein